MNISDKYGYTPLHFACANGREQVAELLLNWSAHVDQATNGMCQKYTPLYEASKNGHEAVVKLLLDRGAEVNRGSGHHVTPSGLPPSLVMRRCHSCCWTKVPT